MSTTETTATPAERAKALHGRLAEIAPYPDTDEAMTAQSVAAYLARRAQVISRQQLGGVAPWDRARSTC